MQRYLLGDPDMLKVHVHLHETEFTAQNICLSHSSKVRKDPVKVSMHALACALRLHGCALAMCVYFTENTGSIHVHVHVHELDSAEYRCMVKVCAPCVGQRRVYIMVHVHHQNDQDQGKFHIARLHCSFALRCVLCCPERQKASHSGSPQNALHCLVNKKINAGDEICAFKFAPSRHAV